MLGRAPSPNNLPFMPALSGLTALVTGASSGIGRAIALAMAREGADVAITYRGNERGAREVAERVGAVGRRCVVLQLDLARGPAAMEALTAGVRRELGRVDVWVNNAGADIVTPDADRTPTLEKLDLLLAVDLRGSILASWAAAELMGAQRDPDGGVIINMSWDHVTFGMRGRNPEMYSAVKGGVLSFSKSLARSVAPAVRVNVLAPGWIETAFGEGLEDARHRAVAESTPLGRWGTPEDVAAAAVYLASPAARFLTGQVINVNGGVVM